MKHITNRLTSHQVLGISKHISKYFPLVTADRIYNLVYQVKSVDTALHLLVCHKNAEATLDTMVYDYLHYQDSKND